MRIPHFVLPRESVNKSPSSVREINWDYVGDAVPAFLTLLIIPLTYNIAFGVIAGVLSYVVLRFVPRFPFAAAAFPFVCALAAAAFSCCSRLVSS